MTMKLGLLWYDADAKKPTRIKIDEAAERYAQKHAVLPNLCFVHASQVVEHAALRVEANSYVQANYFMVGVEEGTAGVPAVAEPVVELAPTRKRKSA